MRCLRVSRVLYSVTITCALANCVNRCAILTRLGCNRHLKLATPYLARPQKAAPGEPGELCVETIGRKRRGRLVQGVTISPIALQLSRNTVKPAQKFEGETSRAGTVAKAFVLMQIGMRPKAQEESAA
jgi:hypothetical protein